MTVAELIDYLSRFDSETEVYMLIQDYSGDRFCPVRDSSAYTYFNRDLNGVGIERVAVIKHG